MVEEEKLPRPATVSITTILGNGFLVIARREALPKIRLGIHFSKMIEDIG